MPVKWIIDRFGVGRTEEGSEKQFPGYELPTFDREQRIFINRCRVVWDPVFWHSGTTQEVIDGPGEG